MEEYVPEEKVIALCIAGCTGGEAMNVEWHSAVRTQSFQALGWPGLRAATDDAELSCSVQEQDFRSVTPSSEGLGLSDRLTTAAATCSHVEFAWLQNRLIPMWGRVREQRVSERGREWVPVTR